MTLLLFKTTSVDLSLPSQRWHQGGRLLELYFALLWSFREGIEGNGVLFHRETCFGKLAQCQVALQNLALCQCQITCLEFGTVPSSSGKLPSKSHVVAADMCLPPIVCHFYYTISTDKTKPLRALRQLKLANENMCKLSGRSNSNSPMAMFVSLNGLVILNLPKDIRF